MGLSALPLRSSASRANLTFAALRAVRSDMLAVVPTTIRANRAKGSDMSAIHRQQDDQDDSLRTFTGVLTGVLIGLALWAGVLALAALITVLA